MKTCRTINGLIKAIKNGEQAQLKVYDIMENDLCEGGKYLNLGQGKYAGVGKENWELIENHVVRY